MDEISQKLDALDKKVEEVRRSVKTIKRIFVWGAVLSIVFVLLPLVGLVFIVPQLLSVYGGISGF